MTYTERCFAVREMANYEDQDAWLSDVTLSSIWGDDDGDIPGDLVEELRQLWMVCHIPFRSLIAPLGTKDISDRFCIPYRTVQNWYENQRSCSIWVRLLFWEALKRDPE